MGGLIVLAERGGEPLGAVLLLECAVYSRRSACSLEVGQSRPLFSSKQELRGDNERPWLDRRQGGWIVESKRPVSTHWAGPRYSVISEAEVQREAA